MKNTKVIQKSDLPFGVDEPRSVPKEGARSGRVRKERDLIGVRLPDPKRVQARRGVGVLDAATGRRAVGGGLVWDKQEVFGEFPLGELREAGGL